MKRTIIKIDEALCNGCGACVTGCHEGALRMINNKAVMVSELYCDGLGACIGDCPVGAITLEEREAEPYNEEAVMERLIPKGAAVIKAHLKHLQDHNEHQLYQQGIAYLQKQKISIDLSEKESPKSEPLACGCPGSTARNFAPASHTKVNIKPLNALRPNSELSQFPIQLHLINPQAQSFKGENLLLAADCTAFANGDFHALFLKGKKLAIACPKLDSHLTDYIEKLTDMIDIAQIDTLTVLIMEVPCCGGLIKIAQTARERASRHIPIKEIVLTVQGAVKSDRWI